MEHASKIRTDITIEGPRDTVSLLMWKLLNEHELMRLEAFHTVDSGQETYRETARVRCYLFLNRPDAEADEDRANFEATVAAELEDI